MNWIKINTDGLCSSSLASCAAIIKDADVKVLWLRHYKCNVQPIHLIELRGALLGIQGASHFLPVVRKLWLEMDSVLCVIGLIKKDLLLRRLFLYCLIFGIFFYNGKRLKCLIFGGKQIGQLIIWQG